MNNYRKINRRNFLGKASCAAIGSSTLFSSLISLKALNAAAADRYALEGGNEDYKALVCLMLSGGLDSFNMLVPTSNAEYNAYSQSRSNLALSKEELLELQVRQGDGRNFGLHEAMPNVTQLFNQQKASFISNVGTLVQPVSRQEVLDEASTLPLGLFSHSDQTQQWQTALPQARSATVGWGGKIADLIRDMNQTQDISMNVSLSGTNVFQAGNNTIEYVIDPYQGSIGINGYERDNMYNVFNIQRSNAIDNLIEFEYEDVFKKTYVDVIRRSRDAHLLFQEALEEVGTLNTEFPDNYLAQSFNMVARTIAARDILGMKRQIFFIDFGGWDHHDELLNSQYGMLLEVDRALGQFLNSLEEVGVADCVTTFTLSEFGRTLTSNGNGTDHGWGGNVLVLGGEQLNGGRIFGEYPDLTLDSELEVGGGVFLPTISTDQYFAELARWFGVSNASLIDIFPNLRNFYDSNSQEMPIGFLNS